MTDDYHETEHFQRRTFEELRYVDDDGGEYRSARELYPILEYSRWEKFLAVIEKAATACKNSGYSPEDHFHQTVKMAHLGLGAQKEVSDYHMSRYGCYLVVQNCDPSKPVIAAGQTCFAIQKRRQELADTGEGNPADRKIIQETCGNQPYKRQGRQGNR